MNRNRAKARQHATRRPADHAGYDLHLYISGATEHSKSALANVKAMGEKHLKGHYRLTVVDLYLQPELARRQDIIFATISSLASLRTAAGLLTRRIANASANHSHMPERRWALRYVKLGEIAPLPPCNERSRG